MNCATTLRLVHGWRTYLSPPHDDPPLRPSRHRYLCRRPREFATSVGHGELWSGGSIERRLMAALASLPILVALLLLYLLFANSLSTQRYEVSAPARSPPCSCN